MALLRYSLLRLALLAAVGGLGWAVGLRGFPLLFGAFLLSSVLSIFVLSRSRGALSSWLSDRLGGIRARIEETNNAEDAWDDAQRDRT